MCYEPAPDLESPTPPAARLRSGQSQATDLPVLPLGEGTLPRPGLPEEPVLRFFRTWHEADLAHNERRASPRYRPREARAWAGWWERDQFIVCRGSVINLSRGGALMLLARHPPMAQPVWICLGVAGPDCTVQGRVHESRAVMPPVPGLGPGLDPFGVDEARSPADSALQISLGPGLAYVSRIEFHGPSPPEFFQTAGHRAPRGST